MHTIPPRNRVSEFQEIRKQPTEDTGCPAAAARSAPEPLLLASQWREFRLCVCVWRGGCLKSPVSVSAVLQPLAKGPGRCGGERNQPGSSRGPVNPALRTPRGSGGWNPGHLGPFQSLCCLQPALLCGTNLEIQIPASLN